MSNTENNIEFSEELLKNHDFLLFKSEKKNITKTLVDEKITKSNKLILSSYQSFINSFISVHDDHNRLLLNFTTGAGKTITALYTAKKFLEANKENKVIVLGFTKYIFRDELARHIDFGILSEDEIKQFNKDRSNVSLIMKINKAIQDKNIYFFGYQEFFNKLFITNGITVAEMPKNELIKLISEGKIQVDLQILRLFKRSLIICDEFHNLYNSIEQNNWGSAIEFVLDYYMSDRIKKDDPLGYNSIKLLLLSATPITHNAIEIIYVLNMLNDKEKVKRSDLFNGLKLKESAESLIKRLSYGKISYINTNNSANFPSKEFIGERIKNIDHIKLVRCEMGYYYYNTYKFLAQQKIDRIPSKTDKISYINYLESEEIKRELELYKINLSLNNKFFMDYVIPNPENEEIGLYDAVESKKIIKDANSEWKNKIGIDINKNGTLIGDWIDYKNIQTYSPKYYELLTYLFDIIKNKRGKVMIFHPYIVYSGTYFISEVLKQNGIIEYEDEENDSTICTLCGIKKIDHQNNNSDHDFKPTKFMLVHGDINKRVIGNMIDRYNLPDNSNGDDIRILVGSNIIKDSFTIKDTQHLFIMHIPVSISIMTQIIGRVVRNNSHENLPVDKRHVNIYLLVNCFAEPNKNILTFEEMYYKKKINDYILIDYINNILVNNAVDYHINKEINNFNNAIFETINYDNKHTKINIKNIDSLNPYFQQKEIDIIKYMIKRIFIEKYHIWKYSDLLNEIYNFPYRVEINPKYILESNFIIALNELTFKKNNLVFQNETLNFGEALLNNNTNDIIFLDKSNNKVIILNKNDIYYLSLYEKRNNVNFMIEPYNNISIEKKRININSILSSIEIDYSIILSKMNNMLLKNLNPIYNMAYILQKNTLRYIIENPSSHELYKPIISIYNRYGYFIYKNKKIIGHCLDTDYHNLYIDNTWTKEKVQIKTKINKSGIIGFHSLVNGNISFKIIDYDSVNDSKDKRKIITGTSCINIELQKLEEIFKRLGTKKSEERQKNKIIVCTNLENIILDKKDIFYNLYNYSKMS